MNSYFGWFGLPGSVVLTALMSMFALVLALVTPTPVRWLCFVAMLLSSVGDVFLARFGGLDRIFPNYFIIGAAFFMAAHLFYILCYGMKQFDTGTPFWNVGFFAAVLIGVALTVVLVVVGISKNNGATVALILIYAVVIFANCATVFSYAWAKRGSSLSALLAAVGVLAFLLSDLIIGLGAVGDIHQYDGWIWWLYPIGQVLLILGV